MGTVYGRIDRRVNMWVWGRFVDWSMDDVSMQVNMNTYAYVYSIKETSWMGRLKGE